MLRQYANTSSPERARSPYLDGLRGLGILLTVVFHSIYLGAATPEWGRTLFAGVQAVSRGTEIMVVLSAFLITLGLLKARDSEHYYLDFASKRVARIIPLYGLMLLGWFFAKPAVELVVHHRHPTFDATAFAFLGFQGNNFMGLEGRFSGPSRGSEWTLALIVQFYLVAPILVRLLSRKALALLSASVLALSIALCATGSLGLLHPLFVHASTPTRGGLLAMGVLLALYVRRSDEGQHAPVARIFLLSAGIGIVVLAAAALALRTSGLAVRPTITVRTPVWLAVGYLTSGLLACGLILICWTQTLWRPMRWLLSRPILLVAAQSSLGIFLLHLWLVEAVKSALGRVGLSLDVGATAPFVLPLYVAVVIVASIAVGWAAKVVVEDPAARAISRAADAVRARLDQRRSRSGESIAVPAQLAA